MACLLCLDANEYAARGRAASAQQKARRGVPPGRLGAVSVNTLFWKILVTRVKRKIVSQFCLVCLKTLFSALPRERRGPSARPWIPAISARLGASSTRYARE